VIEVNARLSRSSALASKATGYPLAFVAAKLGLGYGLHELKNAVTKSTTACFEPALDYVVCKIPRWDLGKFKGVSRELGSSMKSVGEVMAIGRNFEEAVQKGLRMIGQGMHGFVANKELAVDNIDAALSNPTDKRIFVIANALHRGYDVDKIHALTKIDRWFLHKLHGIYRLDQALKRYDRIEDVPVEMLWETKQKGFSDFQIARTVYGSDIDVNAKMDLVRTYRKAHGIVPCREADRHPRGGVSRHDKLPVHDVQRHGARCGLCPRRSKRCRAWLGRIPHRQLGGVRLVFGKRRQHHTAERAEGYHD